MFPVLSCATNLRLFALTESRRWAGGRSPLYSCCHATPTGKGLTEATGNRTDVREFSVVVAAIEASRSIARCLDSIGDSCIGIDTEIIIVSAGHDSAVDAAAAKLKHARVVPLEAASLVPQLWAEGITASSGRIVALLTAHCSVSARWASSMRGCLSDGAAAAGGPIELMRDASVLDAAIYFLRYSPFITDPGANHIAGENAAYVRAALPAAWSRERAFWEVNVNREIVAAGGGIVWCPDASVEFGRSFTFSSICRHRFEHGRLFGIERVRLRGERRARVVAASPIVPFVLAFRSLARVVRSRRYLGRFIVSLPLLLVIAVCWAAGEAKGAMQA